MSPLIARVLFTGAWIACVGLGPVRTHGAETTTVAPAEPTAAEAAEAERLRREEAIARLARGDIGGEEEVPDDALPRNREASLIHFVPPVYPKEMAGTGLTAEVMVSLMVDRQGKASHIRVEDSSDPLFENAALDAINQWEFMPRIREGRISNSRMRFTVLVSEEIGDRAVHDYPGGRIALESVTYDIAPDTPLRREFGLRPVYPFELLVGRKAGEVVIEFVVGADGLPRDMKVIEATHREFAYACQGALVHWKYSAAEKDHRAVRARLRYRMSFQPGELDEPLLALAAELHAGRTGGLETTRTINQQPRVSRSINPSSYDGTRGAPRRRRVTVEIVVNEAGEVRLPRIASAPDRLSGYIALAAVSYWRFDPARKNEQPVAVNVAMPVTF